MDVKAFSWTSHFQENAARGGHRAPKTDSVVVRYHGPARRWDISSAVDPRSAQPVFTWRPVRSGRR